MPILSDDELHRIVARTVQQVLGSAKPSPQPVEPQKPQPAPAQVPAPLPASEKKVVAIGVVVIVALLGLWAAPKLAGPKAEPALPAYVPRTDARHGAPAPAQGPPG